MFNVKEYWENRNKGERGQTGPDFRGRKARGIINHDNGRGGGAEVGGKPVSKKAFKKNTKRARQAIYRGEV